MLPLVAAAAIGAGSGLLQTGFGAMRFRQGQKDYNKLLKNLPQYEIQPEYEQNVNLAKKEYEEGMPGADVARNMVYSSTAAGLSRAEDASTSSVDMLGATTDIYAKELEALNSLAFQQAQFKSQGLERLMSSNVMLAGEKSKAWEINKWNPSQMRLNIAQSKMTSGQSNVQTGLNNLFGSVTSYVTEAARMKELKNIFGGNNTSAATPSSSLENQSTFSNINPLATQPKQFSQFRSTMNQMPEDDNYYLREFLRKNTRN